MELTYWIEIVENVESRREKWAKSNLVVNCCIKPIMLFVSDTIFYFKPLATLQPFYYRYSIPLYSCSEKPRAQESFLKIKTLDLEVSKTLERGLTKN